MYSVIFKHLLNIEESSKVYTQLLTWAFMPWYKKEYPCSGKRVNWFVLTLSFTVSPEFVNGPNFSETQFLPLFPFLAAWLESCKGKM